VAGSAERDEVSGVERVGCSFGGDHVMHAERGGSAAVLAEMTVAVEDQLADLSPCGGLIEAAGSRVLLARRVGGSGSGPVAVFAYGAGSFV
jgi:hypothetical protein